MAAIPGAAMGQIPNQGFLGTASGAMALGLERISERLEQMRTPGWQMLVKTSIFFFLIIVFGIVYQVVIGNNPDDWSHPTDKDGNSIVNGLYTATVINSTVGYGDYYPYTYSGMLLVAFNILIAWIVFTAVL